MSHDLIRHIVYFRIVERAVLTLFVLAACSWLIRRYIDGLTTIDFAAEKLPLSKISMTVGTPVLIVLMFVGYAYVDLSNHLGIGAVADPKSKTAASSESGLTYFNEAGDVPYAPEDSVAHSFWMERNSQRAFTTLLLHAPVPLSQADASRAFYLTSAVGCLSSTPSSPFQNLDEFVATRNWQQIGDEITSALKFQQSLDPYCKHLLQQKQE